MIQQILQATIVALLLTSAYLYSNEEPVSEFDHWQQQYSKFYYGIERSYRQKVYEQNKRKIETHNSDPQQTYQMKENSLMSLTQEEFVGLYLNQIESPKPEVTQEVAFNSSEPLRFVDWSNYCTVKSQGACASGWAFSVTNSLEAWYMIYRRQSIAASTQQFIDCDYSDRGCTGGQNYNAMHYALSIGVMPESYYPYNATQQACKFTRGAYGYSNYMYVGNSASSLQHYLQNHPVSVGIDSSNMQFYSSGVFNNCTNTVNHYALAVGFDYGYNWIVQNSWGRDWGMNGTILLSPGNTCGVLSQAYQIY